MEDSEETAGGHPQIAVVGPCASGKSTLVSALRAAGYDAREVAQEHSYVATLWRRVRHPDLLFYLDVSAGVAAQRRNSAISGTWWRELRLRLRHARQHADLWVNTDDLSPEEVLERALSLLEDYPA